MWLPCFFRAQIFSLASPNPSQDICPGLSFGQTSLSPSRNWHAQGTDRPVRWRKGMARRGITGPSRSRRCDASSQHPWMMYNL
ncbi:hypothetical protein MLD38_026111 [Melastoma candidum]|uniref:Uncharacterized protein n=1 Tax=Melastoma candidum TaxID=119954 RepID=A0ACB9NZC2_9MYRT|nr:hypothetical protein MLD38_026111 [Melastoma candidum]